MIRKMLLTADVMALIALFGLIVVSFAVTLTLIPPVFCSGQVDCMIARGQAHLGQSSCSPGPPKLSRKTQRLFGVFEFERLEFDGLFVPANSVHVRQWECRLHLWPLGALLSLWPLLLMVQRARHHWRVPGERCSSCGYNLTGNVSGVCPECGTPAESIG